MTATQRGIRCLIALFLVLMLSFSVDSVRAAGKQTASKELKVGKSFQVKAEDAAYTSSNPAVAYVSASGRVTAKKTGKAVVKAVKDGKTSELRVKVTRNGAYKKILVCADEIQVHNYKVTYEPVYKDRSKGTISGYRYTCKLVLKNISDRTAGRVTVRASLGKNKLIFQSGKIATGEKETLTEEGSCTTMKNAFELLKLSVVTNKLSHQLDLTTGKTSLEKAGPEDTTAPVISGLAGKDSYNEDMPYRVVYSDDKDYDYLKYVSAKDDVDGKVKVTVDTSKVDYTKTGTYTITYSTEDSAGNVAKAKAKLGVRVANELDEMCDDILKSRIKKSWSDTRKAKAIYKYVWNHITYTGTSDKSSWEKAAKNGIRYGNGDCFTYYSLSRALLTRAGIMNIRVNRVKGHGRHWWNMAYVQGGFYHFDACPRRLGGKFCLLTDSQLKEYSRNYGNSHIWAYDKKPKTPTRKIASVW